jgi:hypothetical protein
MRNRVTQNGLDVSGVAGTSAALLSIKITGDTLNKPDFLGLEIVRDDETEVESFPLKGFKYFKETAKKVGGGQLVSTSQHPVQSFKYQAANHFLKHAHLVNQPNKNHMQTKTTISVK